VQEASDLFMYDNAAVHMEQYLLGLAQYSKVRQMRPPDCSSGVAPVAYVPAAGPGMMTYRKDWGHSCMHACMQPIYIRC